MSDAEKTAGPNIGFVRPLSYAVVAPRDSASAASIPASHKLGASVHSSANHPLAPAVQKLSRWVALDSADEAAILELPHRVRQVRRADYIVREGEKRTEVTALLSGFTYANKVVDGGGRQIVAVQLAGDFVGLQNGFLPTADHNVQALTEAVVAAIPSEAMMRLASERSAVGTALWIDTLVDASIQREWTANVGRRNALARTAHLLCEFGVRLKDAGLGALDRYLLPMTQEELGDALGLTGVHINRTLQTLDRDGLTRRDKHSVSINDWGRLSSIGDFDAGYLHRGRNVPELTSALGSQTAF